MPIDVSLLRTPDQCRDDFDADVAAFEQSACHPDESCQVCNTDRVNLARRREAAEKNNWLDTPMIGDTDYPRWTYDNGDDDENLTQAIEHIYDERAVWGKYSNRHSELQTAQSKPMPTVNLERLDRVLTFIVKFPERHGQSKWWSEKSDFSTYDLERIASLRTLSDSLILPVEHPATFSTPADFCGTTACISGWAVSDNPDFYIATKDDNETLWGFNASPYRISGYDLSFDAETGKTASNRILGESVSWELAGQESLGLTEEEATALFHGSNDLLDILRIVAVILERVPADLRPFISVDSSTNDSTGRLDQPHALVPDSAHA